MDQNNLFYCASWPGHILPWKRLRYMQEKNIKPVAPAEDFSITANNTLLFRNYQK